MKKMLSVVCVSMLVVAGGIRAEELTYNVDGEGFVRNWLVLPSIGLGDQASTHEEGAQKAMFDKEYFADQKKAMPKAGEKVKVAEKDLEWKAVSSEDSIVDLLKVCEAANVPTENCLVMGTCYIIADEDIADVKLKIGSDDSSVWTLNDAEAIRVYSGRGTEKDQDVKEGLTLKKGCNVLKFAVINGDGDYSICARFVDKNDKPVEKVKVSLMPPGARAEEMTYNVDGEGFVRNWLVLSSIGLSDQASTHEEGVQKAMFDKEYFADQKKAMPKAGDKVKVAEKDLEWKAVSSEDSIVDLLKVCEDASVPTENCLVMGACYIIADEDIADVKLKIGSDDSSVWTLNDAEAIRVYSGRGTEKDQDVKEGLTLKKGCNVLKFAVINGDGDYSICARFMDKNDKPVEKVKVSLTPPAAK